MNTPTTAAAGNAMRARFEAAMTAQGWTISRDADTGLYFKNEVQDRWEGWQAALSPGNAEAAGETKAPQGLREALLHALPIGLDSISQTDHDRILAALAPYVTAQPAPSPAREEGASPFKAPLKYVVRERDGSIYLTAGQPGGYHRAFDVHCDEREAAFIVEACNDLTTARRQLAEARAEAKQWNDLHTAADYEVGALRTLASDLAGALEKIANFYCQAITTEDLKIGIEKAFAPEIRDEYELHLAARETLARLRSSTPAPADAPDKLKTK